MKIMKFDEKWVEVEINDFDDFFEDIVLEEVPFIFTDCENIVLRTFLNDMQKEGASLDDCDYFRFDCETKGTNEDIFIFSDLKIFTLNDLFDYTKRQLHNLAKIIRQINNN
jgi:hypothetical protein